jgi:hypothetical protein
MPIGVVQRDCRCPPPAGEGLMVEQDVVGVTALLVLVVVHIYQVAFHQAGSVHDSGWHWYHPLPSANCRR